MVVVLVPCIPLWAQGQQPVWLKHYANEGSNLGFRLAWDGQESVFGIGTLHGSATLDDTVVSVLGSTDILITRWDTAGTLLWARTAGGTCEPGDTDSGAGIHFDTVNDQLVATGYISCAPTYFGSQTLNGSGPLSGNKDVFIAAYSPNGECSWAPMITCSPSLTLGFRPVITDMDGDIFLFGTGGTSSIFFEGTSPRSIPAGGFIAKYTTLGELIHAERVIANGALRQVVWASPTEWFLCGSAKPGATLFTQSLSASSAAGDGYVARVDTTGDVQWVTMLPATGSADVYHGVLLPDGSCVVSGLFTGNLNLPNDTLIGAPSILNGFVARLNEQGEILWALPFISTELTILSDLGLDTHGDILSYGLFEGALDIGQTSIAPYGSSSGMLTRIGSDGELKAVMTFGRTHFAHGSVLTTNHGFYLSSDFDSTLTLGSTVVQGTTFEFARDLFIARFDSVSGFTSVPSALIMEGGGLVIYANPNNGLCTIELPAAVKPGSDLLLIIHDAMGRVVQQAPLRWSEGTIQLDIRAQAKGIYYAELLDGKLRYSGTIVFE